jgi:hypothetical protein
VTFDEAMVQRALETRFGSDYPTRALELATIGCPIPAAGAAASCEEAFSVVFRAPEGVEPQSLLQVVVDRSSGTALIVGYYSGLVELNTQMVDGGRAEGHTLIFAGSAGTEYVPVADDPSLRSE